MTIADEPAVTLTRDRRRRRRARPEHGHRRRDPHRADDLRPRRRHHPHRHRESTAATTRSRARRCSGRSICHSFTLRIPAGPDAAPRVTVTPIFVASTAEVEGPETAILTAEGAVATVTIADEPAVTLTRHRRRRRRARPEHRHRRRDPHRPDDLRPRRVHHPLRHRDQRQRLRDHQPGAARVGQSSLRSRSAFPAGQTTATVTVTPIFVVHREVEGSETVILTAEGSHRHRHDRRRAGGHADAPPTPPPPSSARTPATVVVTRTGPTTYDRDVVHHHRPAPRVNSATTRSPARRCSGRSISTRFTRPHSRRPDDGDRHRHADRRRHYRRLRRRSSSRRKATTRP